MNPILFGSRERQLFGIHTPARGPRRKRGVVICAPLGQEYERAHRACRLLGERMAAKGCDVLRFDYFGTGDSAGSGDAVTFDGCVSDTVTAIEEICAIAGVRRVTLVGVRLGAAVADRAAARTRGVDRLVLWDPISDGVAYIEDQLRDHAPVFANTTRHVRGYPLTETLEQELGAVEPQAFGAGNVREVLLVGTEESDAHIALRDHLVGARESVSSHVMDGPKFWVEQSDLGAGAVPAETIDHIVSWGNAS